MKEREEELEWLRAEQAKLVMPMIGPLLDVWEEAPNDLRSYLKEHYPELGCWLDDIGAAMEFAGSDHEANDLSALPPEETEP